MLGAVGRKIFMLILFFIVIIILISFSVTQLSISPSDTDSLEHWNNIKISCVTQGDCVDKFVSQGSPLDWAQTHTRCNIGGMCDVLIQKTINGGDI